MATCLKKYQITMIGHFDDLSWPHVPKSIKTMIGYFDDLSWQHVPKSIK